MSIWCSLNPEIETWKNNWQDPERSDDVLDVAIGDERFVRVAIFDSSNTDNNKVVLLEYGEVVELRFHLQRALDYLGDTNG